MKTSSSRNFIWTKVRRSNGYLRGEAEQTSGDGERVAGRRWSLFSLTGLSLVEGLKRPVGRGDVGLLELEAPLEGQVGPGLLRRREINRLGLTLKRRGGRLAPDVGHLDLGESDCVG